MSTKTKSLDAAEYAAAVNQLVDVLQASDDAAMRAVAAEVLRTLADHVDPQQAESGEKAEPEPLRLLEPGERGCHVSGMGSIINECAHAAYNHHGRARVFPAERDDLAKEFRDRTHVTDVLLNLALQAWAREGKEMPAETRQWPGTVWYVSLFDGSPHREYMSLLFNIGAPMFPDCTDGRPVDAHARDAAAELERLDIAPWKRGEASSDES